MIIKITKELENLKFPKIIEENNIFYIFGIIDVQVEKYKRFDIICKCYDKNFSFIKKMHIITNNNSTLLWDIYYENNNYILLIEEKSIGEENMSSRCYYIEVNDINNINININKKYINLDNHLVFKNNYDNYILSSKIESDEERPHFYWGKYLFYFYKNNCGYFPQFDKIIDYNRDKGHLLHYIEKNDNVYFIIFSIRHKFDDTSYYYKIYTSKSLNLEFFYDTEEIVIDDNITDSKWYCYPNIFKRNNKYYVLLNQDDYGKNKTLLLGEIFMK